MGAPFSLGQPGADLRRELKWTIDAAERFLGLAIRDSLGAAVEFNPPGTFEPVTGYRAGGPHGLEAGEWTDDTSMALAMAASIAEVGWDLNDQSQRYVRWWQHGEYSVNGRCFDIGFTTRAALLRFQQIGNVLRHAGSRWRSAREAQPPCPGHSRPAVSNRSGTI
jgi:ADP-ribosylglycohydrolase